METMNDNEREKSMKQIEHRFHEQHPLVLVEEQMNESGEKAWCYGCGEVISGPCFSCVQCNYHLHKECAEAPYSIPPHPLHPKHTSGFFLRERPYYSDYLVHGCAVCKEKRNMFFYECNRCYFSLDIKCASSSKVLNQESKPDLHQHPLTFFETPMDEHKKLYCSLCHEPLVNDHVYLCFECPLLFHKKCIDHGSNKVKHPSHRAHPLFLELEKKDLFCKLCQMQRYGCFYSCSLCDFHIHIQCAWPRPIVEDKSRHQHPFNLYFRQDDSFICDACGTEGNYISYICLTCNIMVHKGCTSLPRVIKHSRHDHCLFHKYSLEIQELTRKDCRICFNEVKIERGSYSCVKLGCNYVVHVNCALQYGHLYNVIEDEKQCEELYEKLAKSLQSSITRVVEVNEDGEATVIEHFSHQHYLVLADKIIDRKCDGCMLSLSSTPFYHCPECPFFLHKTCAELPRNKPHWFCQGDVTYKSRRSIEYCSFCRRLCSGFFYDIGGLYDICLRCAKVPDVIECKGHHFLSFDYKCREQCNACGVQVDGGFSCGRCAFTLDFACLTLPHSTHHKFDEHELKLTYEDGDKEQSICDICEKERDPSLWYYHCSICDNSAHTKCVLGQFPFLKDGGTFRYYQHCHRHNDFEFLRKAEGYPECSVCGRLCLEEILKCAKCNYIVHFKCRFG